MDASDRLTELASLIDNNPHCVLVELGKYIKDYVAEELEREHVIDEETYANAIEAWASTNNV